MKLKQNKSVGVAYANELAFVRCIDDFKWLCCVNYKFVSYWNLKQKVWTLLWQWRMVVQ